MPAGYDKAADEVGARAVHAAAPQSDLFEASRALAQSRHKDAETLLRHS
jgi:hypothetical protein